MHRKRFRFRESRDIPRSKHRVKKRFNTEARQSALRSLAKGFLTGLTGVKIREGWRTVRRYRTKYGTLELRVRSYYKQYIIDEQARRRMRREADKQSNVRWYHHMVRGFTRTMLRDYYKFLEDIERFQVLWELMRGRARILFKVYYHIFPFMMFRAYVFDKHLLELDPVSRQVVLSKLFKYAKQKYIPKSEFLDPQMRGIFQRYIAMYMPYPCNFGIYALKITPVTFQILKGSYVTLYVLRWTLAKNVKADPYIGNARHKSYHQVRWTYKDDYEILNSYVFSSDGMLTGYDFPVVASRNDLYEPLVTLRLRDIIFRSHVEKLAFAKANGRPELWMEYGICSAYAIPARYTYRRKLYMASTTKRLRRDLLGLGKRRKCKEIVAILYYLSATLSYSIDTSNAEYAVVSISFSIELSSLLLTADITASRSLVSPFSCAYWAKTKPWVSIAIPVGLTNLTMLDGNAFTMSPVSESFAPMYSDILRSPVITAIAL